MFFKKKPKCQRFFTYDSRELNVSGISATLPKDAGSVKVGHIHIKPEYVTVSEKIQNLDLLQFTLCQEVSNLDDGPKKQQVVEKVIDLKLEMMLMAQNPEFYEEQLKKKI